MGVALLHPPCTQERPWEHAPLRTSPPPHCRRGQSAAGRPGLRPAAWTQHCPSERRSNPPHVPTGWWRWVTSSIRHADLAGVCVYLRQDVGQSAEGQHPLLVELTARQQEEFLQGITSTLQQQQQSVITNKLAGTMLCTVAASICSLQ